MPFSCQLVRPGRRSLSVQKHRRSHSPNLPKRDRFILVGFIWANVVVYRYASENQRSFVFCLHLEEELVEARVVVELGVEGDTELFVLTGGDDTAIDFGQGLGIAVHLDDAGCTDKR